MSQELMSPHGVQLQIQDHYVVMDNGILQVTISKPDGIVTGIRYNGIDNLLEILNEEVNRGYWDVVWSGEGRTGVFEVIKATNFKVITETEDQVEVSFTRPWDTSMAGKFIPINIDKRFMVLRGSSGFYSYGIYEHLQGMPAFSLAETRIAFKLRKDKFHYMAMADNRQRIMPMPDDRLPGRCQPLAYPEAVLLTNPINPDLKGEVDDKYQYSCDNKVNKVHGWICFDPPVGFWQITPSNEFRTGGPVKQNLTSHVGPTTLAMFLSAHYSGEDLVPKFQDDEPWKKVFGPVFIYLNTVFNDDDPHSLWDDAKSQMLVEVQSWPYTFPASEDFPSSDQRGTISGRLLVHDRYIKEGHISADSAYVGLAMPGEVGSWQRECKGYQFWSEADSNGYFSISDVRVGDYNLYGWVPGFIGDYKYDVVVTITPGCDINLGDLVYQPPRDGPTLWEIGIPDRSAMEFYVPDPNPNYINKLFINHPDRFRQYGLWERYAELYPDGDLVFKVGTSDYKKDWFFAQVTRKKSNDTYQATTWQIIFKLDSVNQNSTYQLRLALASATVSELQVRFNDPKVNPAHFSTGLIGKDNSIARHGIHGLAGFPIVFSRSQSQIVLAEVVYKKKMFWSQSYLLCLGLLLQLFLLADCSLKSDWTRDIPRRINGEVPASSSRLRLLIEHRYVVMDNGLLQVTLSKPRGIVTNIKYNGIDNVLEHRNEEENRGYWDLVWKPANVREGEYEKIHGSTFKVIKEAEDQIELSFTSIWYHSIGYKSVPLNIDKRFVMLPSRSGFYSYAIYEHLQGWPDFNLDETRIAFKLRQDLFRYMAISDQRQRIMPTPEDRKTGKPLAYPEAVLLTHPSNAELKGEVDDKYQYSCENQDSRVHGWISSDPPVGFWMINPSDEFRTGGPVKQDLTSHVGPTTLSMFVSVHYSGEDLSMKIRNGEHWKKVFGPVFIYLNSASDEGHVTKLWDNAKQQMLTEVQNWPYSFPASNDFPSSDQRGTVTGRLFIQDRFLQKENIPADSAYLGLAAPGDIGSWQTESKGYQFWTRANSDGSFSINGVRPGRYNLYGWVPGFLGDYKYGPTVTITPGSKLNLGHFIYEPPRQGPTLWEIGIPDRSAAEFYVPDPSQKYINKLYVANTNSDDKDSIPVDKFRQYGLWERYAELYPHEDLVYTVGTSDYSKDWFFAHVDRRNDDNTYKATTWQIRFNLDKVTRVPNETHMLRVAIASATASQLQVRLNNPDSYPVFSTSMIGRDNAIARHGIHGLYWLYNIKIPIYTSIPVTPFSKVLLPRCVQFSGFCSKIHFDRFGSKTRRRGNKENVDITRGRAPTKGFRPSSKGYFWSPFSLQILPAVGFYLSSAGLAHVAVKLTKAFGVKVTVINASPSKKQEALEGLGADAFLVSHDQAQMVCYFFQFFLPLLLRPQVKQTGKQRD
ncbi:hypothetical protein NE237_022285 [Protea cynaroides]|uniref:rhamnogalacturonan endolyase n=1 Tax=Protea cynaroides TaxID=273540 RepID=A0A9Q0H9C1_9MAGN|nr:hypothetical protein NE237_022285 [Protea cynaroides]